MWTGSFWKEDSTRLAKRSVPKSAHHPQANGQTEIMNQILETALRTYVSLDLDDWSSYLKQFALAYNTTPHTSTGFSLAFLLYGFHPVTKATLLHQPSETVERSETERQRHALGEEVSESSKALEFLEEFETYRSRAKEALLFSQAAQQRNYNEGRLEIEFEEGDWVLIDPHSLDMLRSKKGLGKKLQMKYDGPFEILEKKSPVTYRLRMPASYGIHPVLNIAHLEKYHLSPDEFGIW